MQLKLGGLHSYRGSCFRLLQRIEVCIVSEIVSMYTYRGASWLGSKVKVSEGETSMLSILAGIHELVLYPPRAWTSPGFLLLLLSSMNRPAQPLSVCNEGFEVWFETLHWFINAVVHFLKSLFSQMSNLQDHILRSAFFSSFWGRICLVLDIVCSHVDFFFSIPDILSFHLLPFI